MSIRVLVPRDSTALALGANEVAEAIAREAAARKIDIQLVRNGSRGMFWLEPLVEVEIDGERLAFGPVGEADLCPYRCH
jgi:formate dehydrogenase iron-sulfur subunit